MIPRCTMVLATLVLGSFSSASAQDPGRHALAATLSALKPASTVRIRTTSGVILQGTLRGSSGPWSVVNPWGEEPIRLREVDTLWRRYEETRRGMVIGGTAGAIAGGILGVAALAMRNASEVHGPSRTLEGGLLRVAGGIVVGGLAGMGIGSLIGSATFRWEPIYP